MNQYQYEKERILQQAKLLFLNCILLCRERFCKENCVRKEFADTIYNGSIENKSIMKKLKNYVKLVLNLSFH